MTNSCVNLDGAFPLCRGPDKAAQQRALQRSQARREGPSGNAGCPALCPRWVLPPASSSTAGKTCCPTATNALNAAFKRWQTLLNPQGSVRFPRFWFFFKLMLNYNSKRIAHTVTVLFSVTMRIKLFYSVPWNMSAASKLLTTSLRSA